MAKRSAPVKRKKPVRDCLRRLKRIEKAAQALTNAIIWNHDNLPWPICYGVPYREARLLLEALTRIMHDG